MYCMPWGTSLSPCTVNQTKKILSPSPPPSQPHNPLVLGNFGSAWDILCICFALLCTVLIHLTIFPRTKFLPMYVEGRCIWFKGYGQVF